MRGWAGTFGDAENILHVYRNFCTFRKLFFYATIFNLFFIRPSRVRWNGDIFTRLISATVAQTSPFFNVYAGTVVRGSGI